MKINPEINKENNFNLLRLIFALMVIISHVPELKYGNRDNELLTQIFGSISFGELAVDSFFILSGFLIVKSWINNPNIIEFLTNRILRIYPAFILAAFVCVFAIGSNYSNNNYFRDFQFWEFLIGLIQLKLIVFSKVFPNTNHAMLNGSMWTIPYEFKCYLLVLGIGIINGFHKKYIFVIIFIICMIVYILALTQIIHVPLLIYFRLLMEFSAGACFYIYQDKIIWKKEIAIGSLFIFIISLFSIVLAEPALALFFGYFIIYYAKFGKKFLKFNQLPDISYGVYLYAWPINKIVLWYFPNMTLIIAIPLVLGLSIISGIMSYKLIEKPVLKFKKSLNHIK